MNEIVQECKQQSIISSVSKERITSDLLVHLIKCKVTRQGFASLHSPWKLMALFWCCLDPPAPRRATGAYSANYACFFAQPAFDVVFPGGPFSTSVGGRSGEILMLSACVFKFLAPESHRFLTFRSLKRMITPLSAWRLRRWHAAKSIGDESLTSRHSLAD